MPAIIGSSTTSPVSLQHLPMPPKVEQPPVAEKNPIHTGWRGVHIRISRYCGRIDFLEYTSREMTTALSRHDCESRIMHSTEPNGHQFLKDVRFFTIMRH
jgi:hypothetical protein